MENDLSEKYFVKKSASGTYEDITRIFDGVKVLAITGMNGLGKAVNVYREQWITSDVEDFMITTNNGKIVRQNPDITMTFLIGRRYSSGSQLLYVDSGEATCDTDLGNYVYCSGLVATLKPWQMIEARQTVVDPDNIIFYTTGMEQVGSGATYIATEQTDIYIALDGESGEVEYDIFDTDIPFDEHGTLDAFMNYVAGGDFWLQSKYACKEVHCVLDDKHEPKTTKFYRNENSYIVGEIKLHCLEAPKSTTFGTSATYVVYAGFGDAAIYDVTTLTNGIVRDTGSPYGAYMLTTPSTSKYLWICTTELIHYAEMGGFELPLNSYYSIGEYKCYRSVTPYTTNTQIRFTIS